MDIEYFLSLLKMEPVYYLIIIALAFIIFVIGSRYRSMKQSLLLSLLCVYSVFILFAAVFARQDGLRLDGIRLVPFWTYMVIEDHPDLIREIVLNILAFLPVGVISYLLCNKKGLWIGLVLSLLIEILQLITHKGLFETDDIIHNSIGALLGWLFSMMIIKKQQGK